MAGIARLGDRIDGGIHCHGHSHDPKASPGRVVQASTKVFVRGRPAARAGDQGYSLVCCGSVGLIVLQQSQAKVFIEGLPAVSMGTPTLHCGSGPGVIASGCGTVLIP